MVRLQSAITTAVVTPVVAIVEYNYEKNGEIVRRPDREFSALEQATAPAM
jgi:hypothetical protein